MVRAFSWFCAVARENHETSGGATLLLLYACAYFVNSKVRTPGTLALFGAVLEPKVCLVMELAEKGSLYDVLQSDTVDMDWER